MPITQNVLSKYPNPIFIETGTWQGECSSMARSIGFEVYTIEFDINNYNHSKNRFGNDKKIHLYHGSSADWLPKILAEIKSPATIWLDAHPSLDWMTVDDCPIMQELEAILAESKRLKFKVLIDDLRCFYPADIQKILNVATKIGTVSYEASRCGEKDIMVIM